MTVTLDQTPDRPLTIPVTTTPATGPFSLSATEVSYANGDTTLSKTFTVTASDDADAADDSVDLSFGALPIGVTAISPTTTTVTLLDDDTPTVSITQIPNKRDPTTYPYDPIRKRNFWGRDQGHRAYRPGLLHP